MDKLRELYALDEMAKEAGLTNDIGPWFIETKVSPPTIKQTQLIKREVAVGALDAIYRHRACFLVAPAGFGKTCLLTEWCQKELEHGTHAAWLSLEESDAEPRQLLSYIILSIIHAGIPLDGLEFAAQQGLAEISTDAVVPRLVNMLTQIEEPVTLIVDDYHRADCESVNAVIEDLLTYCPENFRVIVSSRTLPDFDIGALVANGDAFELPADHLRLTRDETRAVIGGVADEKASDEIFEQTEGWAVAVQLARIARGAGNKTRHTQIGSDEHIVNYFTRQILNQSTEEERAFLLRTSILDRFNPGLAAAVTGIDAIESFIHQSKHVNSLLVSLDTAGEWYRYHHLFSELLIQQLKIHEPDLLKTLHLKATSWLHAHGLIPDAVRHAKAAGDTVTAAKMITDAGGWELVLYGGIAFFRSLLRNFTRDDFDEFPRLRVAYAYSLLKDGRVKDAEAQLAVVDPEKNAPIVDDNFHRDYYIIQVLLAVYKDEVLTEDDVEDHKNRISFWSTGDMLGLGVLQASLTLSEMALGNFDAAEQLAADGVMSMRQAESVLGINYCYIHLGQCAFYRGDFELAHAHLSEASSMAEDNFGADSRLKTNCDIDLAALCFWQAPDSLDLEVLEQALVRACGTDSWFDIYSTAFGALFESLRVTRNGKKARQLLQLSQSTGRNRDISRLAKISPAYHLYVALAENIEKEVVLAIDVCTELLRDDTIKNNVGYWIVQLESVSILAIAQLEKQTVDGVRDLLDDAVRLANDIGANFFLVRLLVLRSTLRAEWQGMNAGLDDMFRAARIAARASIRTPFCATRAISKYLKSVIRIGREKPAHRLEVSFLTECLAVRHSGSEDERDQLLSVREFDVMEELALGKSNKEIARALDMTDHTVKFHLINIFKKLGVNSRIAAINAGRELNLI